jgi:hypothetical protein
MQVSSAVGSGVSFCLDVCGGRLCMLWKPHALSDYIHAPSTRTLISQKIESANKIILKTHEAEIITIISTKQQLHP